jgi:hypothetical protein
MKSVRSSAADSSPKPRSKLSAEDEAQLISLAQHLLHFRPIQTATETPIIIKCCRVVRGGRTGNLLSDAEKCSLLSALKSRQRCQAFAVAIAKNLGWEQIIDKFGGSDGEQARLSSMISLQRGQWLPGGCPDQTRIFSSSISGCCSLACTRLGSFRASNHRTTRLGVGIGAKRLPTWA